MNLRHPAFIHPFLTNQPSIHPFICPNMQREGETDYCSTHGAGLNNKQEVCFMKYESKNKALPSVKPPTPAQTHTNRPHAHLSLKRPPAHDTLIRDPSPSPLPTVNHTHGFWGGGVGGECEVTRVHGSPLRFTHNPLPPLYFFRPL